MKTPEDLQQINQQIADLEGWRNKIRADIQTANLDMSQQEGRLTGELLQGHAATSLLTIISTDRVKLGGLKAAAKQIDAQLIELEAQRAEIVKDIARADCEQVYAEVRKELYGCIRLLYKFNAALSAIPTPEVPRGYNLSDDASLTRNMLNQLRGLDVYRALIEFERIAPTFMAEARQAKGESK